MNKNTDRFHLYAESIPRASLGRHSSLLNSRRAHRSSGHKTNTGEIEHAEDGRECMVGLYFN